VAKDTNFGRLVASSLTNPLVIAVEVAMLAGVVALTHLDWTKLAARRDAAS
jgi:hypothetical protein